jgi:type I restriction enzyme S subunit
VSARKGDLPDGWVKATIEELCDLNPKHDDELSDEMFVSFIPMAAVSDVLGIIIDPQVRMLGEVRKGYTHFADGDVIFAKITPCMENGKAASVRGMTNGLACGTTEFYVFRPRGAIDQDFLFHFIRQASYRRAARATMQSGVGQARVPKEFVLKTELRVPPLAEQRRIVAKVEALQERSRRAREALSEVWPLLEQFRQSVLTAAFRGDLTADWRAAHPNVEPASELLLRIRAERRRQWEQAELAKYEAKGQKLPQNWQDKYDEPKPVDDSNLPELPDTWHWSDVENVSDWVKDGTHWPPKTTSAGIPFIGIRNIIDGRIDWSTIDKWVSNETHAELTARFPHVSGDVLYTAVGATFGRALLIKDDRKFVFQRHIAHIRPSSDVNSMFLIHALNSPAGFQQAKKVARGAAQPTVTLGELKQIRIPLCPTSEQREITSRVRQSFEAIDSICSWIGDALSRLDQLDQAILAKAFRGELVPQDSSNEPASALLERIRAQPKRQAKTPKQTLKSHQSSKPRENSARLEPQQLTLAEVLRTAD